MEINYNQLFVLKEDMLRVLHNEPALSILLGGNINRILKLNAKRIEVLDKTMGKLQKKYCEFDELGKIKMERKEDGTHDFIFLSTLRDENGIAMIGTSAKDKYYEEANAFLGITFKLLL